jgi:uncharacterized lipoprotein YddW (UPF0748 family)
VIPALLLPLLLAQPPEVRGLWVVRTGLTSPQAVDQLVAEAADGGFNALFVQVRGRGDAFYASRLVNRSPLLRAAPAEFDPLDRLLKAASARGIAVHAWINVLLVGDFLPLPPGHILLQHPEWMMIPQSVARAAPGAPRENLVSLVRQAARTDGEVEGYYLSPAAPGVPDYLESVVRELLRAYPVTGLHLDFIRYPNSLYDFSASALRGFDSKAKSPLEGALANPVAYGDYLRFQLTELTRRLSEAARAERPQIQMSAAVIADQSVAFTHRYQEWPAWLSRGLLDAVCPMAYTPDTRLFRSQISQARAAAGAERGVWAGVGAYRLDLPGILEKVQVARDVGASGVVLFSAESLTAAEYRGLRQHAFRPQAPEGPPPRPAPAQR